MSKEEIKWKECKYLGTILDSEEVLQRRNKLTKISYNSISHVFSDTKLNVLTKIRVMTALECFVYLYNCEPFTITTTMAKQMDVFQRTILRRMIITKWPRKILNKDLYKITEQPPLVGISRSEGSDGHRARWPEDGPARQAPKTSIGTKVRLLEKHGSLPWMMTYRKQVYP